MHSHTMSFQAAKCWNCTPTEMDFALCCRPLGRACVTSHCAPTEVRCRCLHCASIEKFLCFLLLFIFQYLPFQKSFKCKIDQSPFNLPYKTSGLNFSMLQIIFIRVKFFVQAANNFFHAAKLYIMQLWLELFLDICTKISKKCQCEGFLKQICKHQ